MAINLKFASALELSLSTPDSATLNEEFVASLTANLSINESYDVKVFVADEEKNIISEIFYDGWKSPFYYLKSIFPEQTEFKVKVVKPGKNATICARLRKSGKNSFDEKCAPIALISPPQLEKEEPKKSEEVNYQNLSFKPKEKIILNSPTKADNNNKEFIAREQIIRNYIFYSFIALCIILIILLALKQL